MTDALTEIARWPDEAEAEREFLAALHSWAVEGFPDDRGSVADIMARAQGFDRGFPKGSRYERAAEEMLTDLAAGLAGAWATLLESYRLRHGGTDAFLRLRAMAPLARGVDARLFAGASGATLRGPWVELLLREARRSHPESDGYDGFLVVLDESTLAAASIVRTRRT